MNKVSNTNANQIETLDIVRGLAVLLVLKSHWLYFDTKFFGWFEEYFLKYRKIEDYILFSNRYVHPGVLIFIVLSGFIIHYTNKTLPYQVDFRWTFRFIMRRIARLFPVLLVGMILGLLVQHFFYADLTLEDVNRLWTNSLFLYGVKYIHPPTLNNILVTVESEFWLYLFYAVVFRFLTNSKAWFLFFVISFAIWILNYHFNMSAPTADVNAGIWTRNNFYAYLIYWLTGAFCAEIAKNKKNIQISWFLPLSLFLTVLAIIPFQQKLWNALFNEFVLSVVIGVILIKLVSIKPMKFLNNTLGLFGRAGYSVYAFHMCFIMMFTSSSIQLLSSTFFSPVFVLIYTLLGTIALYYVFERPLHLKTKEMFRKLK